MPISPRAMRRIETLLLVFFGTLILAIVIGMLLLFMGTGMYGEPAP